MTTPTARQPKGLLGYFGVKTGGTMPQFAISDAGLLGVMDLMRWYNLDGFTENVDSQAGAIGNAGGFLALTPAARWPVPQTPVYLVTYSRLNITGGAGAPPAGVLAKQYGVGGVNVGWAALGPQFTVAASTTVLVGRFTPDDWFLMPPNSNLGIWQTLGTGAASTAAIYVRYLPIPI